MAIRAILKLSLKAGEAVALPLDLACEVTQAAFLFCLTPECNCYPATAAGWVQAPANITQEGLVSKQGLQRLLSLPESPAGIACHPCQMIRSGQLAVEVA